MMMKLLYMFLFVCVSVHAVFSHPGIVWKRHRSIRSTLTSTAAPTVIVDKLKPGMEDNVTTFLDPPICGLRNRRSISSNKRTVGGGPADLDDFPWMALLGYNTENGHLWMCGGSLISVRHVLTAGHCIYNFEHRLYVVRLGELDYARDDEGAHPVDYQIRKMIVHEDYDPNTTGNDIGILVLQKDVAFSDSIRPICMPKAKRLKTETFVGYDLFIAGWGNTSHRGKPASHLQVTQLPVRKNNECAKAYKRYKGRVFDQTVMCVGSMDGNRGTCAGDSGSPLMNLEQSELDGQYYSYIYVIGLVSYARGCAKAQFPSVFTRVSHFLPWIEEKVLGCVTQ